MPAVSVVVFVRLLAVAFGIVVVLAMLQVLLDDDAATSFARPALVIVGLIALGFACLSYWVAPGLVRKMTPAGMAPSEQMDAGALFACGLALLGVWELLAAIPSAISLLGLWSHLDFTTPTQTQLMAEPVTRFVAGLLLIFLAPALGRRFRHSINPPSVR